MINNNDQNDLRALVNWLVTEPATEMQATSAAIIDSELKPTGQRRCHIVIESAVKEQEPQALDGFLGNAQTADGTLVIQQEKLFDEDGLGVVKSRITITGPDNEDLSQRGAKMLRGLPLLKGYSREHYYYLPTYNPDSPKGCQVVKVVVEITDKQLPHGRATPARAA